MGGDDTPTFGSLFAGIGGLDLGLERAGWRCRWQVERDLFCQRVLAKHWPDVRRYGDIRDFPDADTERVDLICGGFPCQDISSAGGKAGLSGTRSGLWTEMLRVVRILRPRFVFVENVADLRARGLGTALGDLAASGYDAEWDCLQAAAVGAPHGRDRIWLIAYPHANGGRCAPGGQRNRHATPGTAERPACGHDADRLCAHLPDAVLWSDGAQPKEEPRQHLARWWQDARKRAGWQTEPAICRVADGISPGLDNARLSALGNAVVPQVAQWLGERLIAYARQTP